MTSYAKIAAWFFLLWIAVGLPATVLGDEPKSKPKPKLPRVTEEILTIPVKVRDMYHRTEQQDITVTVFEVPGRNKYPLMIINHGRSYDSAQRANMPRYRSLRNARYFASLGFSVWLPTRVGYGPSAKGDFDPEYTGNCAQRQYRYGYDAAAEQSLRVIEVAKQRPHIDVTRIVAVGQSFGGITALAIAAKAPPGLVAVINFAGGGGGRPHTNPGEPCLPDAFASLVSAYGKENSQVPALWVYTENDQYFHVRHIKNWFESYRRHNQTTQFKLLPPFEKDGHTLWGRGQDIWQPIVSEFLKSVGFKSTQSE